MRKLFSLILALTLLLPALSQAAAKATPTPPPTETVTQLMEPPEEIQQVLDLAYSEWATLDGKPLNKVNKYTEWRGKGIGFGWCGGFVTWCMMQCGIPMDVLQDMIEEPKDGLFHVKEASVGKLLRGYQKMGRATKMPQKGFLLVYAVRRSNNYTTHVGLVYDVQDLGGGKYRLTTIEGNMSSRVKMYVHDYDMNAADPTRNLSVIPESERTQKENVKFNYKLQMDTWYVNRFLMPWVPEDYITIEEEDVLLGDETPTPAPSATPEPTPEPTPTPVPTPTPTPKPTPVEEDFSISQTQGGN